MIRAYLFSFFLLSALVSFPASVFGDEHGTIDCRMDETSVPLMRTPNSTTIVAQLKCDEPVSVIEIKAGWVEVQTSGKMEGFVELKNIRGLGYKLLNLDEPYSMGNGWPAEKRGYEYPRVEIFGGYSVFNMSGAFGKNYKNWDNDALTLSKGENLEIFKWLKTGGNASVAFNLTDEFGVVVDSRYHSGNIIEYEWSEPIQSIPDLDGLSESLKYVRDFNNFSFMVGPRFSYRKSQRITPFGHFLVGVNRWEMTLKPLECKEVGVDGVGLNQQYILRDCLSELKTVMALGESSHFLKTGISIAGGGGIDLNVNKSFSIRLVQADYVASRFKEVKTENDPDRVWAINHNKFTLSSGVVFRFGWK